MGIAALVTLAPPPESPIWAGRPQDWPAAEARLGVSLPADYKEFVTVYGAGGFYDFLGIATPFSPKYDLASKHDRSRESFQTQSFFPVFPDRGGLLCMGGDDNGDSLCWLIKGPPNQWPIVYCTEDFIEINIFRMTLVDFLAGWVGQRLHPTFLSGLNIHSRRKPIFTPNTAEMYK